ncbi:MAG: transcription-repair coupling factor [Anaerolineae bacterium]|nr:transcription-repair coupling factor [Anaerolineae bacterium]
MPKAPIIIAHARSVMTRSMPKRDFIKASKRLKPGKIFSPETLARDWVRIGYENAHIVSSPGQFARRGGILDIWPPADTAPCRIEFFGDEIETLRLFDPSSQRTTSTLKIVHISPALEFILPGSSFSQTGETISEFHIPNIYSTVSSILDYLPHNALVVIDDQEALREAVFSLEEQAVSLRKGYVDEGLISEDYPLPYLTWEEIQDSFPKSRVLNLGSIGKSTNHISTHLGERFSPNPRYGGRLKLLMDNLVDISLAGNQSIIVSRQSSRLKELWKERYHPTTPIKINPQFLIGSLTDGWQFNAEGEKSLHLFTDGEIFGWQRPRPRRRRRSAATVPETAYADLHANDWVVHIDHGVGKFTGLVQRAIEGAEREYLAIEYAGGDRLYVPVQQADRLTRYIGASGQPPTPTRLSSSQWNTVKSKVKKAVEDMADELLELYARRDIVSGYAFKPDTPWQQELEASFPFVETNDQVRVINDVKRDMESARPMDRLICGDVGFGKTEIALRAAFKAVMAGKQVAILVPTTVLAQQHYQTFRERLAAFPVETEMLSRFRTPRQQDNIISQVGLGAIDIIIGTHRLLSGDVIFKDLGLLIIDEEQRFGVSHKERMKQMRTEVDVLTLTATPIPRTLYMALTGLRDISTLDTAPEERLPIITHIGPYSPQLIRRAIIRELERGGQVFFVHNRVQTIDLMQAQLARLVPEARIAIAHGQMEENQLSQRMHSFSEAKIDVLLSTSIIESGIDIPNANTLIVDRADTFGLAQLYQLRGRVGRGAQRAYTYLFKHKRKAPTPEGRQRLETLAENTQLGAGFSIAMRDLEIRGAGDLLGTRQHGLIGSVGFHLYTRMLAEAVKHTRANHGIPLDKNELAFKGHYPLLSIDLPLHTTIPAHYVPEQSMRLRLYRRIADMQSLDEIDALEEEFRDRFGPLPSPLKNLLSLVKIKVLAIKVGLNGITLERNQIVFRYPDGKQPPSGIKIPQMARVGKYSLWLAINTTIEDSIPQVIDMLRNILAD